MGLFQRETIGQPAMPIEGRAARAGPGRVLLIGACVAVLVVFVVLRGSLIQPSRTDYWSDTADYLRQAQRPWFSIQLWAGRWVFGVPLVYKLLGGDVQRIIGFQFAYATLAWSFLGLAVAALVRTGWLRPLACALIVLFSLSRDIIQWDFIVLTESISTATFALMIGLWLISLELHRSDTRLGWTRAALGASVVVTAAWSFMRDTNAYFVLFLALLMAAGLAFGTVRRQRYLRRYLGLIVVFSAIFFVQNRTADIGERWHYPLWNVVGKRILVSEERTAFFAARGLPTDQRVMRFRDLYAHSNGNALYRDPQMRDVREWVAEHGKRTYVEFLIIHLRGTLSEPLQNLSQMFRPPLGDYADKAELHFPDWVHRLTGLLFFRPVDLLLISAGALTALALVLVLAGQGRPAWLIPLALVALVYPMMLIVWHGDALEVGRHSFPVSVQLRLALWLLLIVVIDGLIGWSAQLRQRGRQ